MINELTFAHMVFCNVPIRLEIIKQVTLLLYLVNSLQTRNWDGIMQIVPREVSDYQYENVAK